MCVGDLKCSRIWVHQILDNFIVDFHVRHRHGVFSVAALSDLASVGIIIILIYDCKHLSLSYTQAGTHRRTHVHTYVYIRTRT
jgi:hypothetical protein